MATIMSYDEINALVDTQKSLPIDQYFNEMELPKEQKDKRKRFANHFEDELLFLLAWIWYTSQEREVYAVEVAPLFKDAYNDTLREVGEITIPTADYVNEITMDMANATIDHIADPYFVSRDRAKYIAENEANTLYNRQEFADAKKNGMRFKRWNTIIDGRERASHAFADGQEQRIELPFSVGGFYMMFPKDDSLGAPGTEIVNCRCSVTYF